MSEHPGRTGARGRYRVRPQSFAMPSDILTDREREVVRLVAQGKTSKEISILLSISLHTVETHRAHCMEKLGLHSTAELVLYAVGEGLVS